MSHRTIFFLFLLTVVPAGPVIQAETTPLLEPAPDFDKSPAFKTLLKVNSGAPAYEIHKIDYLLERVDRSAGTFIRNGEKHKGKTAAMHLRWKYQRYAQEVKSARDFAEKIASSSRKTRMNYKIMLKNGQIYPAREVILNELDRLENELKMRNSN